MSSKEGDLSRLLHRGAVLFGSLLIIISIFLSFDGFDGSVSGGNGDYDFLASIIGIIFAVTVTVLQFIFASDYKGLNSTLKLIGILSYGYSIYTNVLGAENILHMDKTMAIITALFADVSSEPLLAWGLGEALIGDIVGNFGKIVLGEKRDGNFSKPNSSQRNQYSSPPKNSNSDLFSKLPRSGNPQKPTGHSSFPLPRVRQEGMKNRSTGFPPSAPDDDFED
jgi:hypothetical protein